MSAGIVSEGEQPLVSDPQDIHQMPYVRRRRPAPAGLSHRLVDASDGGRCSLGELSYQVNGVLARDSPGEAAPCAYGAVGLPPHDRRLSDPPGELLLRRSSACTWRAGPSQLGWHVGVAGSDREFLRFTTRSGRSGTQRARAYVGEHLIRRSGHIVQGRPLRLVSWVGIPQLSVRGRCCPLSWQQYWQQSRRSDRDPRPSAFKAGHIPSSRGSWCGSYALSSVAAVSRWLLLLLSPLLSAAVRCRPLRWVTGVTVPVPPGLEE